jgi:uroporphyrinogen decarboxylase
MTTLSHTDRIRAVLAGEKPDRVPVALWRHFPVDDQDPSTLAEAICAFQRDHDFDIVKVTPASSFCLRDWGAEDKWEGNPEGTRRYTKRVIEKASDWGRLKILDPRRGHLGAQIKCLQDVRAKLGPDTPLLQTVFNPLAQARNLAGAEVMLEHMRRWPDAFSEGLERIFLSTKKFVGASREAGADGIFLAVQHASHRIMNESEYMQWGKPKDADLLTAMDGWLNMVHLHGNAVMFDALADLPAHVINWHDREAGPSLAEGFQRSGKLVCGGWRQWETIVYGDPKRVAEEARDAVSQMRGKHLILGTGCVTPVIAPRANIRAASRFGINKSRKE